MIGAGWELTATDEETNTRHVVPLDDLRPHELTKFCWCAPDFLEGTLLPSVIVHNALDQRELYERGRKLQ